MTNLMVVTFMIGVGSCLGAWACFALGRGHVAAGLCLVASIMYAARGVVRISERDDAMAAWDAVLAGSYAYIAWRNRPRKNLGHRLVVAPTGGGS